MKHRCSRMVWTVFLIGLCSCTQMSSNLASTPTITEITQLNGLVMPIPTITASLMPAPVVPEMDGSPAPTQIVLEQDVVPETPAAPVDFLCSPLEDISVDDLLQPDLLKNPFLPPRPGMDDGHHGTDFAYWSRGDRTTMLGLPVLSVLAGRVAGIIHNRQPYGYAVIIETPLEDLPPGWLDAVRLPAPLPTVQPAPNLYCPTPVAQAPATSFRSLYLLYAHLNVPPDVSLDQPVVCGQIIGEVGTTGKSVNYHLHLETRIGPSGTTFPEMAHYENGATDEEMQTYCTWRVSSLFQMFDPVRLFEPITLQP